MKKDYYAIGLMSGSSLDGLDVAYCHFQTLKNGGGFFIEKWELLEVETYPFSDFWKNRLQYLPFGTAMELMDAHAAFGSYMGALVNQFLVEKKIGKKNIDFIASHGHTIFHEPAEGYTTQIGDGAALAVATDLQVINDFRSADVALGGQGAPLAPMADKILFSGYDFYLNLGGIANITCNVNGRFVAFDICGANQILNALANELGLPFDEDGKMASTGELIPELIGTQKSISFFKNNYPKSLSNQWVQENQTDVFLKAITPLPPSRGDAAESPLEGGRGVKNLLHTATELIAQLISEAIEMVIKKENFNKEKCKMLVTGGGAFNAYLIDRINFYLLKINTELIIPEKNIIGFKEAMLVALLGVMRMEGMPNCMASVTGADKDAIGGAVYYTT